MSLETRIMDDLKEAMKAKDQAALRGIRAIKSALLLLKTDGSGNAIDETAEVKMLQKLVKQRQDSLDIFEKQNRQDLAQTEREELEVLMRYMPKQMSREELEVVIKEVIAESGATSAKDMGKVMAAANAKLSGKADGKTISEVVKSLLAN